ncbi:PLP-dependent aminotransferase family protein [Roseomonas sp. 18066]|uniref:aminotransferase-like domain-containing protein n=1 Tax=Roseomonas sp. 18066 TaxID=2681412 RepID=UPI001356983C|nr:PLP-dependent aminotransferase family protein [Roseomonas sp. 18066]
MAGEGSRVARIVARLSASIAAGTLRAGERIASVRQAARDQGVSKNTMAEAYDRLVAAGCLEARRGSGFFVTAQPVAAVPQAKPHLAEALDLVSLLREQGEAHYALRPGDGRPPPAWMERSELAAHFRLPRQAAGEAPGQAHDYGSAWGYAPLRERLSLTLAERGIACPPEQLLLTQGANHALDLIIRQLVEPGDAVLVDDPGYYPLFAKLSLAKARIIGIPRGSEGPDLAALDRALATCRPRAFFTQSLAHNPTGGGLSLPVAHALLQAAERAGFLIIEDDAFADILPAALPRLAALDGLRRVLYVGTFSKTLSASLRVGFVAAPPGLAAALADLKLLTVVATSQYAERLVCGLIAAGHYRRHLARLQRRVAAATERAVADLSAAGVTARAPPGGGFYLWIELPEGSEEAVVCRAAAAESIFLAPGSVFRIERDGARPALRCNVAHAADPRFLHFMRGQFGTR